ncbi:tRNA (uracil) methyltransferase Ecym_2530 [Eremothecium cymbalariae DBVPG|uniref:tRNA (uracil-O(2)-)-methyltransferase n=1 Tax=Eremothecium cymbalariae (strain CBS 270.75 / DBVPG 7215 / KCTC 17166 / NRRL Y-17582) TaxID=931890 RepID=G8JQ93_ERECY|nr:Hypothetical protein Ecym_2530 [Eremothecium cymbalariae DBVPG\
MFDYCVGARSILGDKWVCVYKSTEAVSFKKRHFEDAMNNVIRHPNINSTVILRADILLENHYDVDSSELLSSISNNASVPDGEIQVLLVDDITARTIDTDLDLVIKDELVRRIIPRNPFKDAVINQTCLIHNSKSSQETSMVTYIPHIINEEQCPFYIPAVALVSILLHEGHLSIHYMPFPGHTDLFQDESQRAIRTALRLLNTAVKHSMGSMNGYSKRVNHDVVVDKVLFQDRYIKLKKIYSKWLVDNWVETTDPKKHVFEDIAIAAFLIELWKKVYGEEDTETKFQFRDLGCGNGILCYILIMEGFKGIGIDARQRKSWSIYPESVQNCLKEQVIIPSVLLRPHPDMKGYAPHLEHNANFFPVHLCSSHLIAPATVMYSSADLIQSPHVNITEFPKDTFIIGNHSDELTCWIPLLGYRFIVIPCCSHNLNGAKVRYTVPSEARVRHGNSMYAGLVEHVDYLARAVGWKTEKEMLRIPSTRNAAIIGIDNPELDKFPTQKVYDVILQEGGANGWVQSTMMLMNGPPRSH